MSERESCVCVCSSLPLACFKRPDVPRSRFNHPAVLQSQYGVVPLASIARLEIGVTTYTVGGNIYVRADDTSLQSAADLSGPKGTPFYSFLASQFTATQSPTHA